MPLTTCTECGGQVSSLAATCPHCGAPVAGGPSPRPTPTVAIPRPESRVGSAGNVLAAVVSLFVPGLGQAFQGRILSGLLLFVAALLVWVLTVGVFGWVVHLLGAIDAALWNPRPARARSQETRSEGGTGSTVKLLVLLGIVGIGAVIVLPNVQAAYRPLVGAITVACVVVGAILAWALRNQEPGLKK